ncbi:hypothetical protein MCEREM21A_00313 [Sphingomonadaceae bacterium]
MNLALLLLIGGLVGWVASLIALEDDRRIILFNVGTGMAGALLTGLMASTLIDGASNLRSGLSIATLSFVPLGSALMVMLITFLERCAAR